jgi:hypothetical protein
MFVSGWRGLVSRGKERGAWSVERGAAGCRRTLGIFGFGGPTLKKGGGDN